MRARSAPWRATSGAASRPPAADCDKLGNTASGAAARERAVPLPECRAETDPMPLTRLFVLFFVLLAVGGGFFWWSCTAAARSAPSVSASTLRTPFGACGTLFMSIA